MSNQPNASYYLTGDIKQEDLADIIDFCSSNLSKRIYAFNVFINTYGGEAYTGLAIYDYLMFLRMSHVEVNTFCLGAAMSAGSTIFLAGQSRSISPNSSIMLHGCSDGLRGKIQEFEVTTKEMLEINNRMKTIAVQNSKKNDKYWDKVFTGPDLYLNAEEALKLGIATHILGNE